MTLSSPNPRTFTEMAPYIGAALRSVSEGRPATFKPSKGFSDLTWREYFRRALSLKLRYGFTSDAVNEHLFAQWSDKLLTQSRHGPDGVYILVGTRDMLKTKITPRKLAVATEVPVSPVLTFTGGRLAIQALLPLVSQLSPQPVISFAEDDEVLVKKWEELYGVVIETDGPGRWKVL